MITLPFHKLRQIERLLVDIPLRNLVLVIPGIETNNFFVIYNEMLPPIASDHRLTVQTVQAMEETWEKPYGYVAAPLVGFAALKMVFPNLPFHGNYFFPIGRTEIFQSRPELYYENAYHLAHRLWYKWAASSDANAAALIRLGLMKHIASRLGDLLAVILHTQTSDFPLDVLYSAEWLTTDDVELVARIKPPPDAWIVGFKEVQLINPNLKSHRFIELRSILHSMNADVRLGWKRDVEALARLFREQSVRKNDGYLKTIAYALASEARLLDQDAEDLVAILPHSNFDHFLETGESIYITRVPRISRQLSAAHSRSYTLADVTSASITSGSDVIITFPPLATPIFHQRRNIVDLGSILRKTGQISNLARTLCLLSNDLLTRGRAKISMREITVMAVRAVMLFSLSDPWDERWRGRYGFLLRRAYECLDECWMAQEARAIEPLRSFYKAQRAWYGCFNADDVIRSLSVIRASCRDFLNTTDHSLEQEREKAKLLLAIAEALLSHTLAALDITSGFAIDTSDISPLWDWQSEPPIISPFFYQLLREYFAIDQEWQEWQEATMAGKGEAGHLRVILYRLRGLCQQAYAFGHEARLLCWMCDREKEQIKRWRKGFQRGPMLRLHSLNSTIVMNRPDHLYIEVENIGGSKAHDVSVTLIPSGRFRLIHPENSSKRIELINPQRFKRLSWEIESNDVLLEIYFRLRYKDADNHEIALEEMISVDAIPPQKISMPPRGGNPFQAGTPVFGERFFGREREIQEILNLLLGGVSQPILLRGPRRSGKSSVIWQIRHLLATRGAIRRFGFTAEEEIALRQVRPIAVSLQAIPDASFINRWFQNVFHDICLSVGASDFYTEQVEKDFRDTLPTGAFRFHLDQLLRSHPDMRLLVMIDEWDEQRHLGMLGRTLRYLMQEEQRVNWIVASTWILREELGRYGSPFYSQARPIELKEMAWGAAEMLVRHLSDKAGIYWQSDALVTLLDRTARRPYLIQWLCQEVVDELIAHETSLVDRMLLNSVLSKVIRAPQMKGQPFAFLWEQAYPFKDDASQPRLYWLARLILWTLARSYPSHLPYERVQRRVRQILQDRGLNIRDELFEKEFDEQMAQLEYVFDVITQGDDNQYSFSIPLQYEWFRHIISQHEDVVSEICKGVAIDFGLLELGGKM